MIEAWPPAITICPVCQQRPELTRHGKLVSHHDHFGHWCFTLLREAGYIRPEHSSITDHQTWETFDEVLICAPCNAIDAIAKQDNPKLPRWVSFSWEEMQILRPGVLHHDYSLLPKVWRNRREIYIRPKLRALRTFVSDDAIRAAWHDGPQPFAWVNQ